MSRWILIALLVASGVAPVCAQSDEQIEEEAGRVVALMGGWMAVQRPRVIAEMTEEERQTMASYYGYRIKKAKADGPEGMYYGNIYSYRNEMLKLWDPEIVAETVKVVLELATDDPKFSKPYSDLIEAAPPDAIAMLAPRIFVEEPFWVKQLGDVGAAFPKSYAFPGAMLGIVEGLSAFTKETRAWADDSQRCQIETILPMVRRWWRENEAAFKEKNYKAVRPGEDIYSGQLAKSRADQAAFKAFADGLRAQGKDPNDQKHWENVRIPDAPTPAPTPPAAVATPSKPPPEAPRDHSWLGFALLGTIVAALAARLWISGRKT